MQCVGTSLELKRRFGAGYRLTCSLLDNSNHAQLNQSIVSVMPRARLTDSSLNEATYILLVDDIPLYERLLIMLDQQRTLLGITSYGISATTLEDVFLAVLARATDEDVNDSTNLKRALFWYRFKALVVKRFDYTRRDRKAFFSQILLPALFICLAMIVANMYPPVSQLPPLVLTPSVFDTSCSGENTNIIPWYINDTRPTASQLMAAITTGGGTLGIEYLDVSNSSLFINGSDWCGLPCEIPRNFSSYILNSYAKDNNAIHVAFEVGSGLPDEFYTITMMGQQSNITGQFIRALQDSRSYHGLPIAINLADSALYRSAINRSDVQIITINHPLNSTLDAELQKYQHSTSALTVAIFIIIALSFVPASFLVFLVAERASKAKHLQFSSGVSNFLFWSANYAWDFINYLVTAALSIAIFACFNIAAYTGRNLGATSLLLMFYGFAVVPFMYPAVHYFKDSATAYVTLIVINLFIGLTCTLATFILDQFQSTPQLQTVGSVLEVAFLIFPNYCLGRGLMDIAKNEYTYQATSLSASFGDASPTQFTSPISFSIAGKEIVCLFVQIFVYFGVTILFEWYHIRKIKFQTSLWNIVSSKFLRRKQSQTVLSKLKTDEELELTDSDDVSALRTVVNRTPPFAAGLPLLARDLSKVYPDGKVAVNRLAFDVKRGECFGLLGTNGAG